MVQHLPEAMGFYSASTADSCSISCKSVLGPKIYETSQGWLIIMVHHGPISPILVGISSGSPVKVKFIVVHVTLLLDQGLDVFQRLQKHHISWDTGRFRCSMWSMTTSKGKAPRPKGLKLPIHAWYVSACLRVYTPLGHLLTQAPEKCQQLSGYGSRHQTSPEVALSLEAENSVEICQDSPGISWHFYFHPLQSQHRRHLFIDHLRIIANHKACGVRSFFWGSHLHMIYLSKKIKKVV
jgi:hypothetical protein